MPELALFVTQRLTKDEAAASIAPLLTHAEAMKAEGVDGAMAMVMEFPTYLPLFTSFMTDAGGNACTGKVGYSASLTSRLVQRASFATRIARRAPQRAHGRLLRPRTRRAAHDHLDHRTHRHAARVPSFRCMAQIIGITGSHSELLLRVFRYIWKGPIFGIQPPREGNPPYSDALFLTDSRTGAHDSIHSSGDSMRNPHAALQTSDAPLNTPRDTGLRCYLIDL
ncbi:hypothetical protein B0H13DRAFT_391706 [Mycena leptocephala]|nr:hypothetical protein B0H13DRAFT_391706 [Mycena leptocephala]